MTAMEAKKVAETSLVCCGRTRGPVAVVTLNRPEARNSLSEELIESGTSRSRRSAASSVRAIVITGAGTAFSSGHDLKELTSHRNDPDRGREFFAKTMARART